MKKINTNTSIGVRNFNTLIWMIVAFFMVTACVKDDIKPNVQLVESKNDNPNRIDIGVPGEVKRLMMNQYNQNIGTVTFNSNGRQLFVYYTPNKNWLLMKSQMHLSTLEDFPFVKPTMLPNLNEFAYIYKNIDRDLEQDKLDADLNYGQRSLDSYDFPRNEPYGRIGPLFVVDLKGLPLRGVLALHVECNKVGQIQVAPNEGDAWVQGIKFDELAPAMYLEYRIVRERIFKN